jgi:hypothetical protein
VIHLYKPNHKLMGVIVEPSVIYKEAIAKYIEGDYNTDFRKLLAIILGSRESELRVKDASGLLAMRIKDPHGFVTLVSSSAFKTILTPSRWTNQVEKVFGHLIWGNMQNLHSGYGSHSKNLFQLTRITSACQAYGKAFTVNIDLKPAMASLQGLLDGLGEPVIWGREAGEELSE